MAELKTRYKKGRTRNKKWKISVRFRHQRIKLLKAKNLKYIHANKDNSNENNISPQEMYEKAQTGYAAAKQTSGVIYTAAGRAGKNAGRIFSQVKNHQSLMRTGNIRDAGRIFTRVNKTVENGIKSGVKTGTHKALQSRTDKSKITDTGAETINQALTEMRYTANAGKAVVNTSRTTVKAVTALRNMPRDTRIQVRAIKKTAEKTAKAAKYTASIIKRIIQSSTGKYLAVIIAVFIIVLLLISAFAGISSGIASSFSFLVDSEQDIYGVVTEYEEKIKNYVSKKQQEIQDIYDDFPCDRQNYGSNAEITEFRTSYFDIDKMQIDITTKERYAQIITMCAIQRYRQLDKNETLVNIKFTDDELCKMTDRFYKFEHGTRTDYCPHYDCCQYDEIMTSGDVNGTIYSNTVWYCDRYYHGCQEINEWVEKYSDSDEWDWDTIWSGERTFCDNPNQRVSYFLCKFLYKVCNYGIRKSTYTKLFTLSLIMNI